jgi:hypothetical protein
MPEITIERCTLRVTRRGGWTLGADPQHVVEAATRLLPSLLARHLGRLWADDAEGEIAQVVVLPVPSIRLAELLEAAAALPPGAPAEVPPETLHLGPLDDAIATAVERLRPRLHLPRRMPSCAVDAGDATGAPSSPSLAGDAAVLRVLLAWRERGELSAMLASLSDAATASWERALLHAIDVPPFAATAIPGEALMEAIVREQLAVLLEAMPGYGNDATGVESPLSPYAPTELRSRHRLLVAVEIAARYHVPPATASIRSVLDRILPPVGTNTPVDRAPAFQTSSPASTEHPAAAPASSDAARTVVEGHVSSVLPFLLLGPLAALGYLDALEAAFVAAGRIAALPAFAAGLALKVLEPPERGWRHRPATRRAAAMFAGLQDLPEAVLASLSREADVLASPLDAVVSRAVLASHTSGKPFVLHRIPAGWLVADTEGLFVAGVARTSADLLHLLEGRTAGDLCLVPADAASPELFAALDAAGRSFLTDAPPIRRERWRLVSAPPAHRWWTNDRGTANGALLPPARRLAAAADELAATWRALMDQRPVLRAPQSSLDRSFALAAAVALGYLAFTLWRKRETAYPRLALDRLGDLDAHVRIDVDRVDVRLPLGKRHADLLAHGLLDDVRRVPWLGGRVIRFAGG